MTFIYDNGDVNVGLITAFSIGSILILLILISIFSRSGKKEQEELEEYFDETEPKEKTIVKKRVTTKPRKAKSKVTYKSKAKVKKPKVKPIVKEVTDVAVPVSTTEKKVPKKSKVMKSSVVKTKPDIQIVDKSDKVVSEKALIDSKKVESKVEKEIIKVVKTPIIESEPIVEKVMQNSVKVIKVGNVQVKEGIKLSEFEQNMLSSVLTSSDRGHIIQLFNGSKIMDFPIDKLTQLNHIEKQIGRFSSGSGNYSVYVIWESNLKHRIKMGQKLRYNPNVRYK